MEVDDHRGRRGRVLAIDDHVVEAEGDLRHRPSARARSVRPSCRTTIPPCAPSSPPAASRGPRPCSYHHARRRSSRANGWPDARRIASIPRRTRRRHAMTDLPIPMTPDDFTPDWLTAALRAGGTAGDGAVTAVEASTLGEGFGLLGSLARLRLTWGDRPPRTRPPPSSPSSPRRPNRTSPSPASTSSTSARRASSTRSSPASRPCPRPAPGTSATTWRRATASSCWRTWRRRAASATR